MRAVGADDDGRGMPGVVSETQFDRARQGLDGAEVVVVLDFEALG
jgi:hypothetical protein